MSLVSRYVIFALLATAVNIACQDLVVRAAGDAGSLWPSVLAGTAAGLLLKYYLDKKYIFAFETDGVLHDSRTFLLYTAMGLLTTAVFWGFEFGFDWLFDSKEMRYVGAVIGLGIGYVLKYFLDRRFVFAAAGG